MRTGLIVRGWVVWAFWRRVCLVIPWDFTSAETVKFVSFQDG
ncbi:hypothetical protein RSSM_01291 [Rhodopirellula sallentina SM41]|uniref:Uncharacterized protein n=1 Tax=Rhodopirellula sallentina SM41 TaxID=1263870 RepID=M5U755_9BACT|nr:hypothetical protein RSSM_01291 [Rhodopirellula sallentina SM41]